MSEWPPISEQELLDRLAMDNRQFEEYVRALVANVPPRVYEPASLEFAVGYPWMRPVGSFRLTDAAIDLFEDMTGEEQQSALVQFASESSGRLPVLAIGSNAAPETLKRKFAHFPEAADRAVLALTGRLRDFEVDEGDPYFDEVLLFVSRFGTFCSTPLPRWPSAPGQPRRRWCGRSSRS